PGELCRREIFWCDHQIWLEECGYILWSCYKPGWVPSWRGTDKDWSETFDGEINV
ncbi:hypothetical protein B0H17DRAFT_869345, partial [Mycena rosella]